MIALRNSNRFLDNFFRIDPIPTPWVQTEKIAKFDVDFKETDDEYIVVGDLPGVDQKDINVTLEKEVLTIDCDRSGENEENRGNLHIKERFYGKFSRSFRVPGVDSEQTFADFKNGVLTVKMKKAIDNQKKKVIVNALE